MTTLVIGIYPLGDHGCQRFHFQNFIATHLLFVKICQSTPRGCIQMSDQAPGGKFSVPPCYVQILLVHSQNWLTLPFSLACAVGISSQQVKFLLMYLCMTECVGCE